MFAAGRNVRKRTHGSRRIKKLKQDLSRRSDFKNVKQEGINDEEDLIRLQNQIHQNDIEKRLKKIQQQRQHLQHFKNASQISDFKSSFQANIKNQLLNYNQNNSSNTQEQTNQLKQSFGLRRGKLIIEKDSIDENSDFESNDSKSDNNYKQNEKYLQLQNGLNKAIKQKFDNKIKTIITVNLQGGEQQRISTSNNLGINEDENIKEETLQSNSHNQNSDYAQCNTCSSDSSK